MRAIEIQSKTDNKGHLTVDYQLDQIDTHVRVLILLDESKKDEGNKWVEGISKNPAFDFLNDPDEDIYTSTDGQPFND